MNEQMMANSQSSVPESRQMNQGATPAVAGNGGSTPAAPADTPATKSALDTGARGWRWLFQAH